MKRSRLGSVFLAGAIGASGLVSGDVIERVIARVNGQIVTLSEFEARQMVAVQAARVPEGEIEAFLKPRGFALEYVKGLKPNLGLFGTGCAEFRFRRVA